MRKCCGRASILNVRGVEAFQQQRQGNRLQNRGRRPRLDHSADAVQAENMDDRTTLRAGDHFLLTLIDADAALVGTGARCVTK
ncbi:MAG: hypothetical protein R3F40_09200 [Candidatus Competibacteraceae bacterium]